MVAHQAVVRKVSNSSPSIEATGKVAFLQVNRAKNRGRGFKGRYVLVPRVELKQIGDALRAKLLNKNQARVWLARLEAEDKKEREPHTPLTAPGVLNSGKTRRLRREQIELAEHQLNKVFSGSEARVFTKAGAKSIKVPHEFLRMGARGELSLAEIGLFLVYCVQRKNNGRARFSYTGAEKALRCDRRAVSRALKGLKEKGLIMKEENENAVQRHGCTYTDGPLIALPDQSED